MARMATTPMASRERLAISGQAASQDPAAGQHPLATRGTAASQDPLASRDTTARRTRVQRHRDGFALARRGNPSHLVAFTGGGRHRI
jgi:hypothetical protein